LTTARAAFTQPPVTRFAPSPTGYLHLGHVVNAIYTWGVSRAMGGAVLLRIEDHDRIRSRHEFVDALLEDLDWLGFAADDGRTPLVRQSERDEIYRAALDLLRAQGRVYACDCSRTEIGGERYGGRCRDRELPETSGRGVRVRIDPGVATAFDLLTGSMAQVPSDQCGDLLVKDRDGQWTYQFAATVDDWQQGITLVVRGADLESSTGRQVALGRLLGRNEAPIFLHHPLILDATGRKLSKSAGDTGVRELRARGMSAADVVGLAASAVGLVSRQQGLHASNVPALFDRVSPSLG
jgi:glutamyl/glutaminyl-tRNA synthetase